MIFLVLYDQRGQCQRVAQVRAGNEQPYIEAGFVIVDEQEYRRCAALVAQATQGDLDNIRIARELVQRIAQNPTIQSAPPPPRQEVLDRMIDQQRDALAQITQSYLDGRLAIEQWFRRFVDILNRGNVAATALGVGGIENITPEEQQLLERANEAQARFLTRFRRELEAESSSPAQAIARSKLYGGAVTERYWTAHTRAHGIVLPAMPGVKTSCGSNCKCNWSIVPLAGDGNFDCFWRLSAVENCPECLRRQRVFNPLQIRSGVVQPFNPGGIYV